MQNSLNRAQKLFDLAVKTSSKKEKYNLLVDVVYEVAEVTSVSAQILEETQRQLAELGPGIS